MLVEVPHIHCCSTWYLDCFVNVAPGAVKQENHSFSHSILSSIRWLSARCVRRSTQWPDWPKAGNTSAGSRRSTPLEPANPPKRKKHRSARNLLVRKGGSLSGLIIIPPTHNHFMFQGLFFKVYLYPKKIYNKWIIMFIGEKKNFSSPVHCTN